MSYKDLNILWVEGLDMGGVEGSSDYSDQSIAMIEYILA